MSRRREFKYEYKGNILVLRSNYELQQARRLDKNNVDFEYETVSMDYHEEVNNGKCPSCGSDCVIKNRSYTPDFFFPETGIYVETKGKFDAPSRTKMINVCTQSEEDIRMVFMRDNWLTRKHSMSYSRWCDIKGIPYAIGDIPLEWTRK